MTNLVLETSELGSATLSKDRLYRYQLTRPLSMFPGIICWVMLNPSTADARKNDATIRRCISFSKRFGFGRLVVVNLFAYRSTNPSVLAGVPDPVGPANEAMIRDAGHGVDMMVVAWGNVPDRLWEKASSIVGILKAMPRNRLQCLGKTRSGAPRHPSRLRKDQKLEPWLN